MKDYYQTLGVERNASDEEIKKAYRSLAMKHHPDRGGDSTKFQEIQEAYTTLSDPQRRAEYNNPQPQWQQHGPGGFEFHFGPGGFESMFGPGHPFADFFGFRRPPQNRNIQLKTTIPLEDSFYGKEIIATVNLPSGRTQTVSINIPRGIHEGQTLRLGGMGDDTVPGAPRGDILLNIHIADHPIFKRQGDDLIQEITIDAIDAMLGTKIVLSSIDNKQLETNIPPGTQNESILSINGYGMPNFNDPNRRGRLLIKIKVSIPLLNEEQKLKLKNLKIK